MNRLLFIGLLLFYTSLRAQQLTIIDEGFNSSVRGLSVVNDTVFWVSGSHGRVGYSLDGGETIRWQTVKGYETIDFRAVKAFDRYTAIIMGIDSPAYLLKTTDGGQTWREVYKNTTKGMFLDAMDFYDHDNGVVVGDAIDGRLFIMTTEDAGEHWEELEAGKRPLLDTGEACFAASGSNIKMLSKKHYAIITGGQQSRLIYKNKSYVLPFKQGKETAGANGMAFKDDKTLMIVGGDFMQPDDKDGVTIFTNTAGRLFMAPQLSANGYRSGVTFIKDNTWLACGINGVDITDDNGLHWKSISTTGFHTCAKADNGSVIYLTGNNKLGKMTW